MLFTVYAAFASLRRAAVPHRVAQRAFVHLHPVATSVTGSRVFSSLTARASLQRPPVHASWSGIPRRRHPTSDSPLLCPTANGARTRGVRGVRRPLHAQGDPLDDAPPGHRARPNPSPRRPFLGAPRPRPRVRRRHPPADGYRFRERPRHSIGPDVKHGP